MQDGHRLRAGTARKSSEWVKIAFFMLICANLTIYFFVSFTNFMIQPTKLDNITFIVNFKICLTVFLTNFAELILITNTKQLTLYKIFVSQQNVITVFL